MKKYIICIGVLLLSLWGCSDFLEEQSEDLTYAINCADLEELLVGGGYAIRRAENTSDQLDVKSATRGYYFPWLHVMDDDVVEIVAGKEPTGSAPTGKKMAAYYRWEKDPCNDGDSDYDDPAWTALYKHIGVANAVLEKVDEFIEDSETDRNRIKGQALFLRAYYYFYLVNFYAKPYSAITSSEDFGVPLKTFAYIDDRYWGRATVAEVYKQIISDLRESIRCLDGMKPKSKYWIGVDAARLLLSRVYCYTGKWELVSGLCDTIRLQKYVLFDAVANANVVAKDAEKCLVPETSPEVIFTMGLNNRKAIFNPGSNNLWNFGASDELYGLYVEGDYRKNLLFETSYGFLCPRFAQTFAVSIPGGGTSITKGQDKYTSDIFTLRLAEAYLNQAEALAMTGEEASAREVLQELRECRIAPEFVGTVTESGEDLIKFIREERRRELAFEGHRWFDLRRYAVCPNYPESKEIRHAHYSFGTGSTPLYEGFYLLPGYPDNNWVLPIPGFEIEENQGVMEPNERNESTLY